MLNTGLTKWGDRYLSLAKEISTWSKDPSRKIGAVAVGEKGQILAQGYNGFPRGILDSVDRYNDRSTKYKYVVHAEMNVIYNATFNGVSLDGARLFVYGLPVCSECAKGIIQVGIQSVTVYTDDVVPEIWSDSWNTTHEMFKEAGISAFWAGKVK
jgi:dCMP deaminase